MKIAVVGSGIAGLGAMYLLAPHHEVTLFEASDRLGGHANTHTFERWGATHHVDTGFIVFNEANYPLFTRLLANLGVQSRETTMSFGVSNARSGLEYGTSSLSALFCQARNTASPRFLRMLADLVRFYRNAPEVLARADARSLGAYLDDERYGPGFRDDHLLPMASALWSCPVGKALELPVAFLVRFMANHEMLRLTGRPTWRVVRGGSSRYVEALAKSTRATVRTRAPVTRVTRGESGVVVRTDGEEARFDHVVLACHADHALSMLADATAQERALLSSIPFQENDVVLHHDARLLPKDERAISAWNALVPAEADDACTVSYDMSQLQALRAKERFVITLNRTKAIDPEKVIARRTYHHPVFTKESVHAADALSRLSGERNTHFAGAYFGFGFHEDGLASAARVARAFGVSFP